MFNICIATMIIAFLQSLLFKGIKKCVKNENNCRASLLTTLLQILFVIYVVCNVFLLRFRFYRDIYFNKIFLNLFVKINSYLTPYPLILTVYIIVIYFAKYFLNYIIILAANIIVFHWTIMFCIHGNIYDHFYLLLKKIYM